MKKRPGMAHFFKKKLVDYGGIAMLNLNPELGTYNGWKLPIFWAKNLQ